MRIEFKDSDRMTTETNTIMHSLRMIYANHPKKEKLTRQIVKIFVEISNNLLFMIL